MNRLTTVEFNRIVLRTKEIDSLLDLDLDDDICNNLISELEEFELILKQSLKANKIAERGLVLV